jgi:MFS family permease
MFTYGLTYGPVGWAMPSEVFPSTRRAKGVGLATAVNWIANFIIGVAVPPMIVSLGFGTYVFFACFCILAAIYAFFCIPETGGKTLEQMDEVFKDNLGSEERELQREIMSNVA